MNIFKSRDKGDRRSRKSKKTGSTFMGICPFCGLSYALEIEEGSKELTLICTKCEQIIFYLDKIHTPTHKKNLEDLIELDDIDPYVFTPY